MSTKRGAGDIDAFDMLSGGAKPVTPVASVASAKEKPRRREPVKIDPNVAQRARNYVRWRMANGDADATLAALLDEAVTNFLDREAAEHLPAGEDFPERGALPRRGRLKSSG